MSYATRFTPKAAKQIKKPDPVAVRTARRVGVFLKEKLQRLENPRPVGWKLVNEDFWSYRVGDYRILATIHDNQILVLTVDVAHLREVYRGL